MVFLCIKTIHEKVVRRAYKEQVLSYENGVAR
jgi:hypothetical protein